MMALDEKFEPDCEACPIPKAAPIRENQLACEVYSLMCSQLSADLMAGANLVFEGLCGHLPARARKEVIVKVVYLHDRLADKHAAREEPEKKPKGKEWGNSTKDLKRG